MGSFDSASATNIKPPKRKIDEVMSSDESDSSGDEKDANGSMVHKNNEKKSHVNNPNAKSRKNTTERRSERLSNQSKAKFKPLKPKVVLVRHQNIPANVRMEIQTSNQYEMLTDNGDEVVMTRTQQTNNKPKKVRVPPVIIPLSTTKPVLTAAIKAAAVTEYNVRNTSNGYYIFTNNVDDHKKIKDSFTIAKIDHFSHDLPEDRVSKVILKGLDRMAPEELKQYLTGINLEPMDVKIITPKKSSRADSVIFLLYYRKGSVDMKKLYETKAINHTIVRWEPYRNNRTSLTQCRRCQRFGHGTRNCRMSPRCYICAENHASELCPVLKEEYEKVKAMQVDEDGKPAEAEVIRNITPKCVNCNGAHLASDNSCTERKKYRELQATLARKNVKRSTKPPMFRDADFPALSLNQRGPAYHQPPPQTQPRMFYSQAVNQPPLPSTSCDVHQGNGCSNLFSFQEINSLLKEILNGLRGCTNKADQFEVITNLAIKFVYNCNG